MYLMYLDPGSGSFLIQLIIGTICPIVTLAIGLVLGILGIKK
jgi:hypothetical protein